MKKTIFTRAMTSFAFSVLVAQVVMLILDVLIKDYAPLVPAFAQRFSSDTVALSVNNILIGVIGAVFGGASIIFEIEKWSFLKQGILHFLITTAVWLPIAMLLWGLYLYPTAAISTSVSFAVTYGITWVARYLSCKKTIVDINQQLKTIHADEDDAS